MVKRLLKVALIGVGIAAQVGVPAWMLVKRACVLTYGERYTLRVKLFDPRDLWMGHWVNLVAEEIPAELKGVPKGYLRYYCDQRYAPKLEGVLRQRGEARVAELDVRLWHGTALAEALRLDGMPAYAYVRQVEQAEQAERGGEEAARKRCVWMSPAFSAEVQRDFEEEYLLTVSKGLGTGSALAVSPMFVSKVLQAAGIEQGGQWVPPRATEGEKEAIGQLMRESRWSGETSPEMVLPLFPPSQAGAFPGKEEALRAYLQALPTWECERYEDRLFFQGRLPEGISARALQGVLGEVFPKAQWLLPCEGPLPEGLSSKRVVLVRAADDPPPEGFVWLARAASSQAVVPAGAEGLAVEGACFALPAAPEGLAERLARMKASPHLLRDRRTADRFIEVFAAEAARRYAQEPSERMAACFYELLAYHSWRTVGAIYRAAERMQAYLDALATVGAQAQAGGLVPLGGWPEYLEGKSEPAAAKGLSPEALLALAGEILGEAGAE